MTTGCLICPLNPKMPHQRWRLMDLSSLERSQAEPWAATTPTPRHPWSCTWEEPSWAWTPTASCPAFRGPPHTSLPPRLSANKDAGCVAADSLGRGSAGWWQARRRQTRVLEWNSLWCGRQKKNAVVALVQINKGSENGEGSEAPESTGYKNTISLPS